MPLFYFNLLDTGHSMLDRDGSEFPDLEHARRQALATLGQIAKDNLPDGDLRDFVIEVQDEHRETLLTASLLLRVEQRR